MEKNLEEIFLKDGKFQKKNGEELKAEFVGEISSCGDFSKINSLKVKEIIKRAKKDFSNNFNSYLVKESEGSAGLLIGVVPKIFYYSIKFYKI